jgi:hypothetical protein
LKLAPAAKRRYLRANSGFYTWPLIELCEREKITYAITADLTQGLRAQIEALPETAWRRFNWEAQIAELSYAPHPRPAHRYVVKRVRIKNKQGESYFVYHCAITNDRRRSPKKLMKWFLKRCAMENLIKEHKHDLVWKSCRRRSFWPIGRGF